MLPNYKDDPRKYYKALEAITPAGLRREWKEISVEDYWYLMECVPPRAMKDNAFLVGECMTHTKHGAIYKAVVQVKEKYFSRPAYAHTFNPSTYTNEIREQFKI